MNRKILNLAIPNIISNLTVPLLGIVDLAIVGHLESDAYIGAIALGSMIFNIIYWAFGFLRMGSSGLTAQALGAKNYTEITAVLIRGLIVAITVSSAILIFQIPIEKTIFYFVNGSPDVEILAQKYFYIRVWAAPATISLYVLTGWFIGMQNSKIPMIIAITINILNVILDAVFVYIYKFNSTGVALGTLISQYLGLIIATIFLFKKYKTVFVHINRDMLFKSKEIRRFFNVNKDIFIRTISLLFVFTFFTSKSASTDDGILAANTLLLQFLFLFSFLIDGFAYAAEALTGKYYGALQYDNLKTVVNKIFIWGAIIGIVFSLLYMWFGNTVLNLLTSQQNVISIAENYILWVILIPVISVTSFIWDGIFIGLTKTKQMRNSMLISVFMVFFPIWYFLHNIYGNHALWLAFILFFLSRGISLSIMYIPINKKMNT
jgi:MATE family multidrug resistance protein